MILLLNSSSRKKNHPNRPKQSRSKKNLRRDRLSRNQPAAGRKPERRRKLLAPSRTKAPSLAPCRGRRSFRPCGLVRNARGWLGPPPTDDGFFPSRKLAGELLCRPRRATVPDRIWPNENRPALRPRSQTSASAPRDRRSAPWR